MTHQNDSKLLVSNHVGEKFEAFFWNPYHLQLGPHRSPEFLRLDVLRLS